MNDMVVRVADALGAVTGNLDHGNVRSLLRGAGERSPPSEKAIQTLLRHMAKAAIAAMREPTEAMQVAGHNVRSNPATGLPTKCGTDEIWSAMIDAALR